MTVIDTEKLTGLSEKAAQKRLLEEGYNELQSQKKQNIFVILYHILKEPMLLLLLGSGAIYLLLGEKQDALMLLTFVFVVIGITFYQEHKTERALAALRNLSSPRALVIRDGQQLRIPGREVVKEDLILLREGDRIPADATIISSSNLLVDESLLTGESAAVRKSVWDKKMILTQPGGEDLPFVFSGTMVTQGRAVGLVTSIGIHTQIGKIGKSLQGIKEEDTLLQKETSNIIRNFAIAGIFLSLTIVLLLGFTRGDWIQGFLAGLTLSMAMLPEEFSVVLLIFLALGAWRMSKRKVLTRKTAAIETLGAANVLCVDKTGTITENHMKLSGVMVHQNFLEMSVKNSDILPENYHSLFEYSMLASQKDPFDPIEKEIKENCEKYLKGTHHLHENWKLVQEYPLSKELLALSHVWHSPDKKQYVIASKGAPEAIADLCHFNTIQQKELLQNIQNMSQKGLRVLGVAKALFQSSLLPKTQHDFQFEFVGLIGFTDPVRSNINDSIQECYSAGIRVIMITGDYPGTAQFIAKSIGLKNYDLCITGSEILTMDKKILQEKIKSVNIFARVVPQQKLGIVNALKANGCIVAMTGDGVNDAPALKSAHIGIAMGQRGTDVAREASDLVLLNDDFSSIVSAVKMGRRIFDNLKKAMAYIFAVHVPIAGMSLLPILFNLPVVLLPAHIAFLELIIDPACSVVFESEKEEPDIMNRPPRDLKKPLFDTQALVLSLLQGFGVLSVVFIIFLLSLHYGLGENDARTLAFITIVFCNLLLIITNLSHNAHFIQILKNKNPALFTVLASTLTGLFGVIYVPVLRNLFHFTIPSGKNILMSLSVALVSIVWFEGFKILRNKKGAVLM
jgi:P-type Ca2+ transporter type 2C